MVADRITGQRSAVAEWTGSKSGQSVTLKTSFRLTPASFSEKFNLVGAIASLSSLFSSVQSISAVRSSITMHISSTD